VFSYLLIILIGSCCDVLAQLRCSS
jgi:hypothetical protein